MYRWREIGPKGEARMRKQVIGTLQQYPSKTAAWRAVELLRLDINYEAPRPESLPADFGELIGHYRKVELDRSQPSVRKTDQTKQVYDSNLRTHIEPRWQQYRPREITSVAVEKWLTSVDLADGSKAKLKYIMSDVFQHGIRYGWLRNEENPMLAVRQSAKRVRIPEPLEANEFLQLLAELPLKIRTMGIVCATTGLRISEVLGLKWGDIDFEQLLFHVTRSVVDGVIGKCKTETSRKPLPLDRFTVECLREWQEKSVYPGPEDWVFASEWQDGEMPPWADTLLERHLQPAAKAAGITKHVGWPYIPAHLFDAAPGERERCKGGAGAYAARQRNHNHERVHAGDYEQEASGGGAPASSLHGTAPNVDPWIENRSELVDSSTTSPATLPHTVPSLVSTPAKWRS